MYHGGLMVAAVSAVLFQLYQFCLNKYIAPPSRVTQQKKTATYYNTLVSFTHSTISSLGCIYCFYIDPHLMSKINGSFSNFAYFISSVSLGYFVHDFLYFMKKYSLFSNGGIVIHHIVVVACFGLAVVQKKFVNFVIVALLCEINSIFLHLRQMLNMAGVPSSFLVVRVNNLVNIVTYIFFRIFSLSWMLRWLVLHKGVIPELFHTTGMIGMSVMTVVNIVLFARLLSKDYWPRVSSSTNIDSLKGK